jgi:hypothetical protein
MTLLIATLSNTHVVLTSDGLCIKGGGKTFIENYQKIFPIPELPIAIAHHGQNIINNRNVKEIVSDFIAKHIEFIKNESICAVAELLVKSLDADAKETLVHFPSLVIGFWIVGFGKGNAKPQLYEVCWPDDIEPIPHKRLTIGGSAQDFIKKYLSTPIGKYKPEKIKKCKVKYAYEYHNILYRIAKNEQAERGSQLFGGHKQRLLISKPKCLWIISPSD